jgi:hypothetical protein
MDKIIVYVDDADHALQQLVPMNSAQRIHHASQPSTQWILVACAPRVTKHVSKWVSRRARESWRTQWSEKLFGQITPTLSRQGDTVQTVIAKGDLAELTEDLLAQYRGARVMDARRPRFGQDLSPVTRDQPTQHNSRWSVPGAVAGMSALMVLASD